MEEQGLHEVLKKAQFEIEFLREESNRKDLIINKFEEALLTYTKFDSKYINTIKNSSNVTSDIGNYFKISVQ